MKGCDKHPQYTPDCDECRLTWFERLLDDIEELYLAVLLEYDTLVQKMENEGKL